MPTREITKPLFFPDQTKVERWKLSFIASELYQRKEGEELHCKIWELLKQSGLHPKGKVSIEGFSEQDIEDFKRVWGLIVQEQIRRSKELKRLKNKRA